MPYLPSLRLILFILVSLPTFHLGKVIASYGRPTICVADYGNYTEGSLYQKHLNLLLSKMTPQASLLKFYNSTLGDVPNQVYGIFQCREDISLDVCSKCVADASKIIIQNCPLFGEAIIWYDECMLRYANRSIFSLYEVLPVSEQWTTTQVSNAAEFDSVFTKTMDGLISDASFGAKSRHFATREANVTLYDKLYSLAQCTPDLNGSGCKSCLKAALIVITNCCRASIRARAFLPSCILMYDMMLFYNHTEVEHSSPDLSPLSTTNINQEKRLKSSIIAAIAVVTSAGLVLVLIGVWLFLKRKAVETSVEISPEEGQEMHIVEETLVQDSLGDVEFMKYNLATLKVATEEFSISNKLGEGGFGGVYKGTLKNGKIVAIKRLSCNSGQGTKEFMTEACIVAKLQHRNLVKLLGFCSEGKEKLLIYEFLPNTSLDRYLFNEGKKEFLQWETRYKIILGITRGLQYLHEDSRLIVVHRDLKTSNILLDTEMNPKIADFGLAKLFAGDEKYGNTNQISGTQGYMAPEYILTGEYSDKSDVYSFGIIVLEILSGRRNKIVYHSNKYEDLSTYAWRLWNECRSLEFLDPALYDNISRTEVRRCIHDRNLDARGSCNGPK